MADSDVMRCGNCKYLFHGDDGCFCANDESYYESMGITENGYCHDYIRKEEDEEA